MSRPAPTARSTHLKASTATCASTAARSVPVEERRIATGACARQRENESALPRNPTWVVHPAPRKRRVSAAWAPAAGEPRRGLSDAAVVRVDRPRLAPFRRRQVEGIERAQRDGRVAGTEDAVRPGEDVRRERDQVQSPSRDVGLDLPPGPAAVRGRDPALPLLSQQGREALGDDDPR